ncbi:MAG: SBBP repeat-containing protein, partial [Bryobacterales bacterium]|nr:SBBP repeat-containing protein [Bryobacterales bacterium]
VYVAGWTKSTNFRTQSAIQTHLAGINNAYAFKLAPGGTAFIYSTYIGGNGIDYANGLTIDSSGNAYIYGDTTSTNFPLQNAMQPSFCGWTSGPPAAAHGYVTVLGSSGSLVYSTYVCGSAAQDSVRGAAVAANGDLVITGQTMSTTFPILNGLQTTSGGGVDAFMTALSPSGGLVYSSYLGGNGTDIGRGVAFDSIGNWYFTGQTSSTNFPTVNPVQSAYGGGSSDVFVTKISGAGTTIAFSTYLGGSDDDIARSIVVDSLAQAYITGNTKSSDFPTANPIQATFGGGKDDAFWSVIATCDFTFSSPSAVSSAGGAGSISITTTPQCGWTATSNNSFITLTSTASGTGSGSISYSVAPSNGSARTGTVTIAGQTITITQSAGPAISGVNPSTGAQGAANFAFAITGTMTHFVAGMSAVAFSGTGITAGAITVVDATHLSVNVSIAATAPLGARDVIVTTGTEVATSPAGFTVVPASALASISPNNGVAGGTFAVTLNGTNLNGAIINAIPGITITPASSTATTVTATFAIALGAAIGPQTVTVTNAGAISNGLTFTINPPSPSLTSISPNNGVAGDAGFAVTLNGANLSGANINAISGITISGVSSTATSVSATFTIASGASSGPQNVTVTTAGGTSNAVVFTVIPQPPTLSSISPNSASAGSAAFSVTLNGTNLSGATINPVPGITITGVSSTASSATATFAIASGATTGPQNVTVTTAGGTSNSVAFTISAPIPALTSISPNSGVAGSPAVGVTLNGTNLSGATINSIPGITITGVTSTASTVTAAFTISSAATAGPQSVTVATAGGTSNAVTFTINVPAVGAAITSTPSGASVTITGAGCASGTFITPATLNWNASVLCRVSFADPLTSGGATYAFQSSTVNGSSGSRSSSVFVPSGTAALTINATYLAAAGLASSGTATHFSIVPSSFAANPGVPIQFTVTALDGSNNPATTYSDPVHFASSDGLSSLPPDTALINGVGTFTASFVTIGSQTITATDLFVPTITGWSGSITLSNASGLTFIPITPCRVMDTRPGRPFTGAFGVPYLSANTSRSIPIPTGACGTFPGALAYSMNVTVVPHSTLSFLTIWPSGQPQPAHASTLNSLDGRYKANAAIVPAGTGGAVSVYVTDATDVIVDINGYFVPNTTPGGLVFYPMTPCRVMDTRMGHGFAGLYGPPSLTPPFVGATSGTSRTLPVQSSTNCTIPPTAQVYSLNFTVVPTGPLGWLSAWPHGQPEPSASILNAPTGTIVANAAIIPAGTDSAGSIDIFVHDATDVIVDINGYFAPPGAGGLSFYPLTPCRVTDTRMARGGSGPFSGSMDDNVLGVSTTGNVCGGTPSAQAYVFNATVAPPAPLPYLTLWPQGAMLPHASTLNANDGAITSNMAIVPTTNTEISAYANTPTDLILDLAGYFAP